MRDVEPSGEPEVDEEKTNEAGQGPEVVAEAAPGSAGLPGPDDGSPEADDWGGTPESDCRPNFKAGTFTPRTLASRVRRIQPHVVERICPERSIGILMGRMAIGKTPVAVTEGIGVASNRGFFGLRVFLPGPVIYAIAEGSPSQFDDLVSSISKHMGLDAPPENFLVNAPLWGPAPKFSWEKGPLEYLEAEVSRVGPRLVILDTLRAWDAMAEEKNSAAAKFIERLRRMTRATGASVLVLHHPRKPSRQFPPSRVTDNAFSALDEASGARALITQADVRLSLEESPRGSRGELVLGGFVRGVGEITPIQIVRRRDEDGLPVGFVALRGAECLTDDQRLAFERLPAEFTFKDIRRLVGGGRSDSNAARYLEALKAAGLAVQDRRRHPYRKVNPEGRDDG